MASLFLKAYGDNPKLRVLDFLLTFEDFDYSMKDIAKFSEVSYTALKEIWKALVKRKIVIHTRTVGKAKMYKLNRDNPLVEKFIDYYWSIADLEANKESNKEEALVHIAS